MVICVQAREFAKPPFPLERGYKSSRRYKHGAQLQGLEL